MRIVFIGTPLWAVPTLEKLVESRHEIPLVVTQPDKPAGRGRRVKYSPVKELAVSRNLPIVQPLHVGSTEFVTRLRDVKPDLIVLVAYGKILPREVLRIPRLGSVNGHFSLLPAYRGAAPVHHAIINGETKSGVTIMEMDEDCDTGGIIAQKEVEILDDDDSLSLGNMLSVVGASLLLECLDDIEQKGHIESTTQDDAAASLAPMLRKKDGMLDWSLSTRKILLRIRGMSPWPSAYTYLNNGRLKILKAEDLFSNIGLVRELPEKKNQIPGRISGLLKNKGPIVRTGDGFVILTRGQPENKRAMSGEDLINGKFIQQGDVFSQNT